MNSAQIRSFNPNIHLEFAKAFLETGLVPTTNMTPEKLIRLTRGFIWSNIIGYCLTSLSVVMGIIEIPTIMIGFEYFEWWKMSTTQILLIFFLIIITLGMMLIGIMLQERCKGAIECSFLRCMLDLQEAYGSNLLNFSLWNLVQCDVKWELVDRAGNVKLLEKELGLDHLDTKDARCALRRLLGVACNFRKLTIAGKDETPYFTLAGRVCIVRGVL